MNVLTPNRKACRAKRRGIAARKGATVVETAVVLPIFFLLLLGAYEFGRLGTLRSDITSVAYDAARFATRDGATREETIQFAQQQLASLGVKDAQITVEPAPETALEDVTVFVNLPISKYGWITPAIAAHQQLASSVTLRVEVASNPDASAVRQATAGVSSSITSTSRASFTMP